MQTEHFAVTSDERESAVTGHATEGGPAWKWNWRNNSYSRLGGEHEFGCHDIQWSATREDAFWGLGGCQETCGDSNNVSLHDARDGPVASLSVPVVADTRGTQTTEKMKARCAHPTRSAHPRASGRARRRAASHGRAPTRSLAACAGAGDGLPQDRRRH